MNQLKLTDRIGLNAIFGIISPGILVMAAFMFCLIAFAQIFAYQIHTKQLQMISSILKDWNFLIGIMLFFTSYLFGSVIRLFSNDFAEVLSGFYLRHLRRNRSPLATDRFPYPFAAQSLQKSDPGIFAWYKERFLAFADESQLNAWERKYFYNKCKSDLYARSASRALYNEKIESFVRFLSGALVADLFLFAVSLPFASYFLYVHQFFLASAYGLLSLFSLVVILSILENFRKQHTREVMNLWTSYYELCHETPEENSVQTNSESEVNQPKVR